MRCRQVYIAPLMIQDSVREAIHWQTFSLDLRSSFGPFKIDLINHVFPNLGEINIRNTDVLCLSPDFEKLIHKYVVIHDCSITTFSPLFSPTQTSARRKLPDFKSIVGATTDMADAVSSTIVWTTTDMADAVSTTIVGTTTDTVNAVVGTTTDMVNAVSTTSAEMLRSMGGLLTTISTTTTTTTRTDSSMGGLYVKTHNSSSTSVDVDDLVIQWWGYVGVVAGLCFIALAAGLLYIVCARYVFYKRLVKRPDIEMVTPRRRPSSPATLDVTNALNAGCYRMATRNSPSRNSPSISGSSTTLVNLFLIVLSQLIN